MIESRFDINFVYGRNSDGTFSNVLALLDADDELDYSRQSERRVILKDALIGCSLALEKSKSHLYTYDKDLVTLVIPCEDLVFYEGKNLFESALGFVQRIYRKTNPQYVFGMHDWRMERVGEDHLDHGLPSPITDEGLARNRIDYPTWLMLFSPEMIEEYGREWLLELPAERVDEFDSRAIMVVATEDFLDCESDTEIAQQINSAMEPLEEAFESKNE